MLKGARSVSVKMIFKVLVSIALVFVSIEARPPPTNENSWEQLIREFKDMEKIRHDALQVVLNKPEYKEDENMVKYMATLTELDRNLVDTRKAIKDVPSILNPTKISTDTVDPKGLLDTLQRRLKSESEILKVRLTEEGKAVSEDVLGDNEFQVFLAFFGAQKFADDFKILRARARVIENKLKTETKDVPAKFLWDKDCVTVLDALNAGTWKLLLICLRMFIEVTSSLYEKSLEPEVVSVRRAVADNAVM